MFKKYLITMLLVGVPTLSSCKPTPSSTTTVSSSATTTATSVKTNQLEVFTDGNQINALLISGNNLWAATMGGLVRWDIQKGDYRKYTIADGLASDSIYSLTQDHQGNIWFTTNGGVSRFDGTHFQNFTAKDGLVSAGRSIICDVNGNIITANYDSAISLCDGKSWQTISPQPVSPPTTSPSQIDVLSRKIIISLAVDNTGKFWAVIYYPMVLQNIGGEPAYSLEYFDGKSWHSPADADGWATIYHSLNVATLTKAPDGGICFLTDDDFSIVEYNGKSWQTIAPGYPDLKSAEIAFDGQGTLWCSNNSGISRYNGRSWQNYDNNNLSRDHGGITDIVIDTNDNIWCGSKNGIFRFDGQAWQTCMTQDNLSDNNISSLFVDNLGNIWFTTLNTYPVNLGSVTLPGYYNTITRYDGKTWRTFTQADGLPEHTYIQPYFQDKDGNIWAGGANQIFRYDGKTWQTFDESAYSPISCITQDRQGNLWFGAYNYVIFYDGNTWQRYSMQTANDNLNSHVNDIAVDWQGTVWVSTTYGVRRFNGTDWQVFTNKDGLISNDVRGIFVDSQGRIWFIDRQGIDFFDGQKWSSFTSADSTAYIPKITEDGRHNIWYNNGPNKGVMKYDGANWTNITVADGLSGNTISSILADAKGNLWFCTDHGLSYYDGTKWQSFVSNVNFYKQTIIAKDGSLWSTVDVGFLHFTP